MSKNPDNLFESALKAKEKIEAGEEAAAPAVVEAQEEAAVEVAPVLEAPEDDTPPPPTELDMLKNRARLMGVTFSNNIGVDALKQKMEEHAKAKERPEVVHSEPMLTSPGTVPEPEKNLSPEAKRLAIRQKLYEENMRLVRLRITNLDPKKKDLPGEIFTFANEYLGTIKKFVPFGEATDNGYHVPYCIYKMLLRRQFLQIKTRKSSNGTPIVSSNYVREFALEVLPPLTEKEISDLAQSQMARGIQD